jgi:hypothetical protein
VIRASRFFVLLMGLISLFFSQLKHHSGNHSLAGEHTTGNYAVF